MRVREKFGHYLVMIGKLGAKQRTRDHLPLHSGKKSGVITIRTKLVNEH